MTLFAAIVTWTDGIAHDAWQWLLANLNLVAIVGAFRMWSMSEHRKTARALESERATLAALIASTARAAALRSHNENAELAIAIQENTAISTQAFHEANSVNQKIANIGSEQAALAAQQVAMQKDSSR